MKYLLIISLAFFTGWCKNLNRGSNEKPLAQVGNSYLYSSDLNGLIKQGITKEDSSIIIASLTEKWIRKQLILQKAELNLTDDEKDVNKELDEYRTSLIIYKYEQKLIKEKLDTIVSEKEIEQYYNQFPSNFVLNYNIAKALFIKLSVNAPNKDQLREWIKNENEENVKNIETYCYQNAIKYDYFSDNWVNLDNIKMLYPYELPNNEQTIKATKLFEAKDSVFQYFLSIKDFQSKGNTAPLIYVEKDIKNIILLKRKQKLINDLENKIYFEALTRNNFKIYKE